MRAHVLILMLGCVPSLGAKSAVSVPCRDLPAAVREAAAKHEAKPGTEAECEKISEDGRTLYEVKITRPAGGMREIVMHPDGRVEEVEDESDVKAIPAEARSAILRKVGSATLRKVDVIRRGSLTLYEGEYRVGETKKKVIVDARGRIVQEQ